MKNIINITGIIIIIISFNYNLSAQQDYNNYAFDTASTYSIKLKDGNEFIGKFIEKDSINIVIATSSIPRISIPISNIKSVTLIKAENVKAGVYWFPNPHSTKYLFGPSAFNLNKGEGYYQNTYLFLNSFQAGITKNISMGGGLEFLSTFSSMSGDEDFKPTLYSSNL